jgi:hypothetical protein
MLKQGITREVAFYGYGLELVKAAEEVTINGGVTYYPPATTIPSPINSTYVKPLQTPPDLLEIIESYLPLLYPWAEGASAQLLLPPREFEGGNTPTAEEQLEESPLEE